MEDGREWGGVRKEDEERCPEDGDGSLLLHLRSSDVSAAARERI